MKFVSRTWRFMVDLIVILVSKVDSKLTPFSVLVMTIGVVLVSIVASIIFTAVNYRYFYGTSFCLDAGCLEYFFKGFGVQRGLVTGGAQIAIFIALVLGPYIALKSYISTNSAQAFGNNIAHIGFFESFVRSEVGKRDRMRGDSLDIFSLYRLMFPESAGIFSGADFVDRVNQIFTAIEVSNQEFSDREAKFDFSAHRTRMVEAFAGVFVKLDASPRIDFLETEDQLIDFVSMLIRVFCRADATPSPPLRLYR